MHSAIVSLFRNAEKLILALMRMSFNLKRVSEYECSYSSFVICTEIDLLKKLIFSPIVSFFLIE